MRAVTPNQNSKAAKGWNQQESSAQAAQVTTFDALFARSIIAAVIYVIVAPESAALK